MNANLLIGATAVALFLAGLALGGRAAWKALVLRRRRRALQSGVESFLSARKSIQVVRWLGVGNVGGVVLATLRDGWEREIGTIWKSCLPMPAQVVVKVAQFSGGTTRRREILGALAADIESDLASTNPVPICPMLALGFIEGGLPDGNALIEVMPLIPGVTLKSAIALGKVGDRVSTLREFLNILRTVRFLEDRRLYNRNLDSENVMVQPDGHWVRIDYDSIKKVDAMPLERMERLSRLAAEVLGAVASTREDMALLARVRQQSRTAPESWRLRGLVLSTEELVAEFESLPGVR